MVKQMTEMTGTGSQTRPAYAPAAARPATAPRLRGTILAPVGRLRFMGAVCPATGGFAAGSSVNVVGAGTAVQGTGVPVATFERAHGPRVTGNRSLAVDAGVMSILGYQTAFARPVPPVPGSTHERPPA